MVDALDRLRRQLLQRYVRGAGDVLLEILLARKHLEEERILLGDEPLCLTHTDIGWHPGVLPIRTSFQRTPLSWQTARVDDDDLLRRAEQALTEIKVNHGLREEHEAVLAALRIRLTGSAGKSLEEMLAATEDRPDDLEAKIAEAERASKPSLDDLLSRPQSKPEWPA